MGSLTLDGYIKKKQLLKRQEYTGLEKPFLTKARKNLAIANLLFKISGEESLKKILSLPADFEAHDWVIIVSYYSMYVAALAAIARLGFKSKSHAATILVLQHYYIKQGLPAAHIDKLAKAYVLSEELITKLLQTKTKRENAQYEATPTITLQNAVSSVEDADVFITKIEEMLLR